MYLHHLHLSQTLRNESATSKSCQWSEPMPMKMVPKTTQEVEFWETQTERRRGGGGKGEKTDQLRSTPSR